MDLKGFESEKKEEKKVVGRKPDFKGSISVAGWIETDKNGKQFLNVRIGEGIYIRLYPNENPSMLVSE